MRSHRGIEEAAAEPALRALGLLSCTATAVSSSRAGLATGRLFAVLGAGCCMFPIAGEPTHERWGHGACEL